VCRAEWFYFSGVSLAYGSAFFGEQLSVAESKRAVSFVLFLLPRLGTERLLSLFPFCSYRGLWPGILLCSFCHPTRVVTQGIFLCLLSFLPVFSQLVRRFPPLQFRNQLLPVSAGFTSTHLRIRRRRSEGDLQSSVLTKLWNFLCIGYNLCYFSRFVLYPLPPSVTAVAMWRHQVSDKIVETCDSVCRTRIFQTSSLCLCVYHGNLCPCLPALSENSSSLYY
jgi:hypothetical protein